MNVEQREREERSKTKGATVPSSYVFSLLAWAEILHRIRQPAEQSPRSWCGLPLRSCLERVTPRLENLPPRLEDLPPGKMAFLGG